MYDFVHNWWFSISTIVAHSKKGDYKIGRRPVFIRNDIKSKWKMTYQAPFHDLPHGAHQILVPCHYYRPHTIKLKKQNNCWSKLDSLFRKISKALFDNHFVFCFLKVSLFSLYFLPWFVSLSIIVHFLFKKLKEKKIKNTFSKLFSFQIIGKIVNNTDKNLRMKIVFIDLILNKNQKHEMGGYMLSFLICFFHLVSHLFEVSISSLYGVAFLLFFFLFFLLN